MVLLLFWHSRFVKNHFTKEIYQNPKNTLSPDLIIYIISFLQCGSILPSEINHLMDRRGAGGIDPKMMVKKKKEVELI